MQKSASVRHFAQPHNANLPTYTCALSWDQLWLLHGWTNKNSVSFFHLRIQRIFKVSAKTVLTSQTGNFWMLLKDILEKWVYPPETKRLSSGTVQAVGLSCILLWTQLFSGKNTLSGFKDYVQWRRTQYKSFFTCPYVYFPSLLKRWHFSILNWSRFNAYPSSLVKALFIRWRTFYFLISLPCSVLTTSVQDNTWNFGGEIALLDIAC